MQKFEMRAMMSLPATIDREALKLGDTFKCAAQERRDLLRLGRAEDVRRSPIKPAKSGEDDA